MLDWVFGTFVENVFFTSLEPLLTVRVLSAKQGDKNETSY